MAKHVQNPAVEAFSMGGFKITSLADGTASGDAVNYGQLSGAAAMLNYWTLSGSDVYRSSGKVGINTSSLPATLSVETSGNEIGRFKGTGLGATICRYVNDQDVGIATLTYASTYSSGSVFNVGAGGSILVGNSNAPFGIGTIDYNQPIFLGVNGQRRMQLETNGNVTILGSGIDGTLANVFAFATSSYPNTYLNLVKSSVSLTPSNSKLVFSLSTGASSSYDALILNGAGVVTIPYLSAVGYVTNDASGNLSTSTASATASALNYWTLSGSDVYRSSGNVGIGVASPSEKLSVVGNIYLQGTSDKNIGFNSASNWRYYLATSNDDFRIYDAGGTDFIKLFYAGGGTDKLASVLGALHVRNTGNVGILTTSPTATIDVNGGARIRNLSTNGNLVQHNGSGDLASVSPYDFSGTLTANRSMTLGSYSFTLDASTAASSPGTMLILKGKETSFSTRFIDYQNESGTTSFRMSSTSSQVTLAALNSHDLRIEGVNSVTITNNLDRGFVVKSSGDVAFHSGLSTAPSSPSTASMWWLSDRLQIKRSSAVANIATVEDDLMGEATQVITASTHTLAGQYYFTRYSASSNAIVVTLGDDLLEGITYHVRCTGNGTNTVTFNAGGSNVFYVDEKSTTTLTTLVTGASGTGIEAPNRILTIIRRSTVIFIK